MNTKVLLGKGLKNVTFLQYMEQSDTRTFVFGVYKYIVLKFKEPRLSFCWQENL